MKAMKILLIITILSLAIAFMWDKIPAIKDSVHAALDPSLGRLLDWNKTIGMLIIIFFFSILTNLVQKYGTDQATLRLLKKEQKILSEEAKKYKDNPEKMLEFQKKQMEFIPKTMDITMRPIMYTFIPFILLFRWFNDYFTTNTYLFLGFMSWFIFYLIASIFLSSIFKKLFKVA